MLELLKSRIDNIRNQVHFIRENNLIEPKGYSRILSGEYTLRRVPLKEIFTYEKRNNVTLPRLFRKILNEIGVGQIYHISLISSENRIPSPFCCLRENMLDECIKRGVSQHTIHYGVNYNFDFERNIFTIPKLNDIYQEMNGERDKLLGVLIPINSCAYLVLNENTNNEVAVFNVYDFSNFNKEHNGQVFQSPYFKYTGQHIFDYLNNNLNGTENYLSKIIRRNINN